MEEIALTRFSGFADGDKYRPRPPVDIANLIMDIIGLPHVDTIVDLGCGTGLSTQIWKGKANRIIGIEPNDDMRNIAKENNTDGFITFLVGSSYAIDLPDNYVDIVVSGQAFHWMEPVSTLNEVSRILKTGGVRNSGHFSYSKELFIHNREECGEERFINLALSQGSIQALLKNDIEEVEKYIKKFEGRVKKENETKKNKSMWTNYRIRMGIKK